MFFKKLYILVYLSISIEYTPYTPYNLLIFFKNYGCIVCTPKKFTKHSKTFFYSLLLHYFDITELVLEKGVSEQNIMSLIIRS